MMVRMLSVLLLACDAPAPDVTPETVSLAAPSAAVDPIAAASDPARYGDAWLVLLQSSTEPGVVPESWAALSDAAIAGVAPARLNSGHYKGLMPCYEIVVAAGSSDKSAMAALSAELKAAGVDNYMKNAGAYIGTDPRIEEACRATVSSEAPAGVRIAVSRAGALRLPLELPAVVSERVLSGLTVSPRGEDFSAWYAPIPVQTIGAVSIGQAFTVAGDGAARSCAVTGFEALQEGQPHFGDTERGPLSRPMCGELVVHAVLDCDSRIGAALVVEDGTAAPVLHVLPPLQRADLTPSARQHSSFATVHAALTAQARDKGEPLAEEITAAAIDGTELTWVRAQLTTGDGMDTCGGEDINTVLVAAAGADGAVTTPFVNADWSTPVALARIGEADHWLVRTWTDAWVLLSPAGEAVYRWDRAFCDCAC